MQYERRNYYQSKESGMDCDCDYLRVFPAADDQLVLRLGEHMNRDECNLMGCEGVFNCIVPEDERPQKCRDWKVVCLKRLEEVTCQK